MALFNNKRKVSHQIGEQNIYGDTNYYVHDVCSIKRLEIDQNDADPYRSLDENILSSLAFPQMTNRRRSIDVPHRQTCSWIFELDEYKSWISRPSGLLWIKGKPGAGKSTLMSQLYSSIAMNREQPTSTYNDGIIYLEFFFSARGVALERSALGMLRTLSSQIFQRDPNVRPLLRTSYQEKHVLFGTIAWEWQRAELERLLSDMVLASSQELQTIIFVDALDEAGEAAEDIARYFHDLNHRIQNQSAKAKICISCRHYPVSSGPAAVEIHVEKHNRKDISTYIRDFVKDRIVNIDDPSSVHVNDRELWQRIIKDLASMANGIFQWARLVMPLLKKRIDTNGDSIDQIQKWLVRAPVGLEQMYEYIFDQVIDQEHKTESLRLFQWVCLATRPLSVSELRYALATHDIAADPLPRLTFQELPDSCFAGTDEVMQRRIKSRSGGLVEVVEGSTHHFSGHRLLVVQPIHLSVKTFLLARGFHLLSQSGPNCTKHEAPITRGVDLNFTVARGHGELYWSCLKYIATEGTRSNIHCSGSEGGRTHRKKWESVLDKLVFIEYTLDNIIVHAEGAQSQRGQDIEHECQLLEHAIPAWAAFWKVRYGERRSHPMQIGDGSVPLHIGAAANMTNLVDHLAKRDVDVSVTDCWGQTALHLASRRGHLTTVKVLVEAGANLNATTYSDQTPLFLAAEMGNLELFRWLLGRGASVDPFEDGSTSTLTAAAKSGSVAIINLCIEASAGLGTKLKGLEGALIIASGQDHEKVVQTLIEAGADVNAHDKVFGTALQEAARNGAIKVMQFLLRKGADVNAEGTNGNALEAASQRGKTEAVQILLDAGAKVNIRSGQYFTALQATASAYQENEPILQMLLMAGTDVNAQGGHYGTALQAAAVWPRKSRTIQVLLKAGANINAQGGQHGTALQAAALRSNLEVLQILLEAGADINAIGGEHGTALIAAVASEPSLKLVQILIDAGADVNFQNEKYGSALQWAANEGNMEVVQVLIKAGADINAQGGYFGSPLQAAGYGNNIEVIQVLLNEGADVNTQGGIHGNALQAAVLGRGKENDHIPPTCGEILEIVQTLLRGGADVNAKGGYYGNALQAAAYSKITDCYDVLQTLIDAGANANAQGGIFGNALQAAAYNSSVRMVQMLLNAGAEINCKGGRYGSALQAAASPRRGEHEKVIQLLLTAGADVNIQGGEYGNALQAAAFQGDRRVVQVLIEAGADVNSQGGKYGSALQAAVSSYSEFLKDIEEVVQILLNAGADVNARGGEYGTAINAASKKDRKRLKKMLIAAGAKVEDQA